MVLGELGGQTDDARERRTDAGAGIQQHGRGDLAFAAREEVKGDDSVMLQAGIRRGIAGTGKQANNQESP